MNTIHLQLAQECLQHLSSLEKMSSLEDLQKKIDRLDAQLNEPGLWSDPRKAAILMKDRSKVSEFLELLTRSQEEVELYLEMIRADGQLEDQDGLQLSTLHAKLQQTLFKQMMSDPADEVPAIITINQGAGGLESANWVTMLKRMYARYADSQGFKLELLDEKPSEEHGAICTDSVSIRIEGPYAYGFFKGESGVHRLIRNSPFNAGNARQTSFAGVYVTPDIEDTIDIKIEDKDLEISTMRASGSGGQSVNKIESAVRIKHLPTGIIVNSRAESSQHTNRRFAMKMLKSKLYEYELKKKNEDVEKSLSQQAAISFGSQIRTYTETPYSLVKDHRTDYGIHNFDEVLDGNIQGFMVAYLQGTINNG